MVPAPHRPARPSTWWWFLIPLFSLGFGTFLTVLFAGLKLKSRANMIAGGGYLLVMVVFFCGVADPNADTNAPATTASNLLTAAYLAVVWLGGTAHVAILQHLAGKLVPETTLVPTPHSPDLAVEAAARRAARRAEARNMLTANPTMAWELRIGRPDIAERQYDDGGLVDVNHVPAGWIAYALQIPMPLAEDFVRAREGLPGGLTSAEDLLVRSERLTTEQLAMIRDLLVFRPL